MRASGTEWSWGNSPLLLPLAFEEREGNAVYVAFFLAECLGSKIRVVHVKGHKEDEARIERFLGSLKRFASKVRVDFEVEDVKGKEPFPSEAYIAKVIAAKAEEHGCQAVIMAAHKEPFFRELFGRVSDRVARIARCKVILVETPKYGIKVPENPTKIFIPVLEEGLSPEPFVLTSALTSSASAPNVEIVAVKIVQLPAVTPLGAIEVSDMLKREEQEFSRAIGAYIKALGRLFTPRMVAVRDVGRDMAELAKDFEADLMVMACRRPKRFHRLITRQQHDVIRRAPSVALVVFPELQS